MAHAEVLPRSQQSTSGRPGDPCIMVIFGAAGDLTRRKLIPALYNLAKVDLLPQEFAIVGVAHNPMSDDEFRKKLTADIAHYAGREVDSEIWEWFQQRLYYLTAEFDDKNTYAQLKSKLEALDREPVIAEDDEPVPLWAEHRDDAQPEDPGTSGARGPPTA